MLDKTSGLKQQQEAEELEGEEDGEWEYSADYWINHVEVPEVIIPYVMQAPVLLPGEDIRHWHQTLEITLFACDPRESLEWLSAIDLAHLWLISPGFASGGAPFWRWSGRWPWRRFSRPHTRTSRSSVFLRITLEFGLRLALNGKR